MDINDHRPILVTGATGYVGGRLVPRLVESGYHIRTVSRSLAKLQSRPWSRDEKVEIHEGDVLDRDFIHRTANGCRAAMILGSGSASFEILRYIIDRLPIILTPKWVNTPCQPIAIRNVLHYLAGCLEIPETTGQTFDIGGPDVLSYRRLMEIYTEEAGLHKRLIIPIPIMAPAVSAYWIHMISPLPASLATTPETIWKPVGKIGGDTGWYFGNLLWRVRGEWDRLTGGIGLRRGRRNAEIHRTIHQPENHRRSRLF